MILAQCVYTHIYIYHARVFFPIPRVTIARQGRRLSITMT